MRLRDLFEMGRQIDLPQLHVGDTIRVDGQRRQITGEKRPWPKGQPRVKTNKGEQKVFAFDIARLTQSQPNRTEEGYG